MPSSSAFPLPLSLPFLHFVPCNFERWLKGRQDLAYLYRRSAHGGHAPLVRRGGRWDEEGGGGGQEEEADEVEE